MTIGVHRTTSKPLVRSIFHFARNSHGFVEILPFAIVTRPLAVGFGMCYQQNWHPSHQVLSEMLCVLYTMLHSVLQGVIEMNAAVRRHKLVDCTRA